MSAVCKSNLKQIFIAESSYISSNDGRITPATYTNGRSYDDLLSSYMGREMTLFKQKQNLLSKDDAVYSALNNQSLMCPNDTTPRDNDGMIPRTYVGNGRGSGFSAEPTKEDWGPMRTGWAPFAGQVEDSSGTISFTEYHGSDNYASKLQKAALDNANELISTNGSNVAEGYKWATPHGKYLKYNFAYWDGHVVEKNVNSTFKQSSSPSGREWSMDPSD
ncbi:MAG: hypothetical protein NE330_07005 [Lentisphaeraceae bacterium]|nr:hypothetical protein [Lentisphaeraceae bacterium]